MSKLSNLMMNDGTLCFYTPDLEVEPYRLRQLVGFVEGVKLTGAMDCDAIDICWFEFDLAGNKCMVNNPYPNGTYWFIVENPDCEKYILENFVQGLERLFDE